MNLKVNVVAVSVLAGVAVFSCSHTISQDTSQDAVRRRWAKGLLDEPGAFAEATWLLDLESEIGVRNYDGGSCVFAENAKPVIDSLSRAGFGHDTDPAFIPRHDFEECSSYKREVPCGKASAEAAEQIPAAHRAKPGCMLTDGTRFCISPKPVHDKCQVLLEVWAGRWAGSDTRHAVRITDPVYRAQIAQMLSLTRPPNAKRR